MLRLLTKKILALSFVQWVLSAIAAAYVVFVKWTSSVDRQTPPVHGPVIIAMWHSRLAQLHFLRIGRLPLVALVSQHRDGQLIQKCASHFGIEVVAGSTRRGGRRAAIEVIKRAQAGHSIFITPDGPRGPRMQATIGVVKLARMTGLPILPATICTSRTIEMRSWDRFLVPLPFSRIAVRWGEPIHCGPDDNPDAIRKHLERQLNELQQSADGTTSRGLRLPERRTNVNARSTGGS